MQTSPAASLFHLQKQPRARWQLPQRCFRASCSLRGALCSSSRGSCRQRPNGARTGALRSALGGNRDEEASPGPVCWEKFSLCSDLTNTLGFFFWVLGFIFFALLGAANAKPSSTGTAKPAPPRVHAASAGGGTGESWRRRPARSRAVSAQGQAPTLPVAPHPARRAPGPPARGLILRLALPRGRGACAVGAAAPRGTHCPPRAKRRGLEGPSPSLTLTQRCSGTLPVAKLVPKWWKPGGFPGCKSGFPIGGGDNRW